MKTLFKWKRTGQHGKKAGWKLKVRPAIPTYRKKWSRTTYWLSKGLTSKHSRSAADVAELIERCGPDEKLPDLKNRLTQCDKLDVGRLHDYCKAVYEA